MALPGSSPYVIVGAGIHGLSTGYHLAKELKARGLGSGADIVVLEKSDPGAGASGIACGVVRNNYFQPAMAELMQACVEVWESDPVAYHYQPVGYIALGPEAQEPDLAATYERQEKIGYRSTLFTGADEVEVVSPVDGVDVLAVERLAEVGVGLAAGAGPRLRGRVINKQLDCFRDINSREPLG